MLFKGNKNQATIKEKVRKAHSNPIRPIIDENNNGVIMLMQRFAINLDAKAPDRSWLSTFSDKTTIDIGIRSPTPIPINIADADSTHGEENKPVNNMPIINAITEKYVDPVRPPKIAIISGAHHLTTTPASGLRLTMNPSNVGEIFSSFRYRGKKLP